MISPDRETSFLFGDSSKKLRPHFQAHVINVMIDHPLKKAMNKIEATGRLIQWAIELNEFDVKKQLREEIKAQVLAAFIAEFTPSYNQQDNDKRAPQWIILVDGSSTQHAGGVGIVLQSLKGDRLESTVSNN